jgi:hypothetical protein
MKGFFSILLFILVAIVSWGVYGPMLKEGQTEMHGAWRPFMCVGLAYFVIAVVVPLILLQLFGEKGHWSTSGVLWSLIAGVCGAVGALGVILAAKNGGNMLYVMPLVFGGAPVVNSIIAIYLAGSQKQVGPVFLAGLIVVIAGSVTVMLTAPRPQHPATAAATAPSPAANTPSSPAAVSKPSTDYSKLALVYLFTALTALSFGCYGPALHKGGVAMAGSRMRPFLCVGVAYFLVAVIVPGIILRLVTEPSDWGNWGTAWSFGGGAVGAIGALGVIMAFTLGGKPVYVMPLVFGGAPVINTFVALTLFKAWGAIGPIFVAGLILTAAGAVTVLVFAPRSHAPAPSTIPPTPPPPPPRKIEPKRESV